MPFSLRLAVFFIIILFCQNKESVCGGSGNSITYCEPGRVLFLYEIKSLQDLNILLFF